MPHIPFFEASLWHKFFFFLGTESGEFAIKSFALLIFGLLTYMLWHEYLASKRDDLKILSYGFASLTTAKIFSVILYASLIFGAMPIRISRSIYQVIDVSLESFALILLTNALIYPLFRNNKEKFMKAIKEEISIFSLGAIILETSWILFFSAKNIGFEQFAAHLFFTLFKIGILGTAIFQLLENSHIKFKFREWVFVAFITFAADPIIDLSNFLFFQNTSVKLEVAGAPFPLIAALIIFRLVYLKLVDKAMLRKKVKISEQKYLREKEVGELKDKFLSVVSHELRTPLTSIKLYLGLLDKNKFGKINKKQKDAIAVVKKESNRLTNLINDVLDLSKMESGKARLSISNFRLREIVTPIQESEAQAKKIRLMNAIPPHMEVNADQDKIRQVIINLLSNAMKYTPAGGKITISASENSSSWSIRVSDTGLGMEKEELNKIFDKFYQVEHHMTRSKGGTGLGLSIVKEIVDMHKGSIGVESEVGKGTTFIISVPKDIKGEKNE